MIRNFYVVRPDLLIVGDEAESAALPLAETGLNLAREGEFLDRINKIYRIGRWDGKADT